MNPLLEEEASAYALDMSEEVVFDDLIEEIKSGDLSRDMLNESQQKLLEDYQKKTERFEKTRARASEIMGEKSPVL